MTTETDIAYLAGLIDGEGYIGIKRSRAYACQGTVTPGYHARIQVRMVNEEAIKFLSETLGGWYFREKSHCNNGRPLYCYQASNKKAEAILRTLLPYLRVKRSSAETVLALRDLQATRQQYRTKVVGTKNFPNKYGTPRMVPVTCHSDEYVALCEALWQRCRDLNKVGATANEADGV